MLGEIKSYFTKAPIWGFFSLKALALIEIYGKVKHMQRWRRDRFSIRVIPLLDLFTASTMNALHRFCHPRCADLNRQILHGGFLIRRV